MPKTLSIPFKGRNRENTTLSHLINNILDEPPSNKSAHDLSNLDLSRLSNHNHNLPPAEELIKTKKGMDGRVKAANEQISSA